MATEQIDAVVFKDQAGEYFVLPQAVLERGRVPAEARAAIEAQVTVLRAGDDVQGHHPMIIGAALGIGVTLAGFGVAYAIRTDNDLGPLLEEAIEWAQNQR